MLDRLLEHPWRKGLLVGWLLLAGCDTSGPAQNDSALPAAAAPNLLTDLDDSEPSPSASSSRVARRAESSAARPFEVGDVPGDAPRIRNVRSVPSNAPETRAETDADPEPSRSGLGQGGTKDARSTAGHPAAGREAPEVESDVSRARSAQGVARLPAPKPIDRSPQLAAVVEQAEAHNRQGFDLANRGACFSARSEFLLVLRILSQGLDAETHRSDYSRALAAGLRALDESDDFFPRVGQGVGEIDLAALVRAHRTRVLEPGSLADLTPPEAAARYYAYAEAQLAVSVGAELPGSLALHALGKIHSVLAKQNSTAIVEPQSKALVFQRTALEVDPNNYLAANDLAVLVAQRGSYVEARELLLRAVSLTQQPALWQNLSVVHARLGETRLAELAERMAVSSSGGVNPANAQAMAAAQQVQWVDPATFARMSPPPTDLNRTPAAAAGAAPPSAAKPGTAHWFPWNNRQQ